VKITCSSDRWEQAAGLSCAKYLTAGHTPIVLERQDVLGGKVAAWKDETATGGTKLGCISLGHPNMLQLFKNWVLKTGCSGHAMINQPDAPGTYSRFDFPDLHRLMASWRFCGTTIC